MGAPDIPQPKLPPPPPDYADQAIRDAELTQRRRSMTAGGSRRKSFLGGSSAPAVSSPALAGKTFLGQ